MAEDNTLQHWLDELQTLRDELKVRAHLANREVEGRLAVLDDQWETFRARAEKVGGAAEDAGKDVSAAFTMLGEALRDGFKKVSDELDRQR